MKALAQLFFCSCAVACLSAFAATLNLRQLMGTPFASGLKASPDGRAIAWVVSKEGERNVWVAAGPDWQARQATQFSAEDGMEIAELAWSADSRWLVFTRAGEFGADRQPNPAAALQPPKSMLWIIPGGGAPRPRGGAPRVLAEGHAAVFSPRDNRVWFLRSGQAFSMTTTGAGVRNEFKCEGTVEDLTWSANGLHLAFRNQRGSHGFIGVFTPGSAHMSYLDPSVDTDSSPIWSPDGSQIAFLREPAATTLPLEAARREAYPWSIRVAQADGRSAHELFHADPGPGSVHHDWDADKQLFWSAANEIYFGWERTGWLHLYSISTAGGTARELSPGQGEIADISQSGDRSHLTYSANIGHIETPHVWVLDEPKDIPTEITNGDGAEWSPFAISSPAAVVFLASTYINAAHTELATSERRRSLGPPATAPFELVKPTPVTFESNGGVTVHAQVFRPAQDAPHPAIVFVHGGPRRQMYLGFHSLDYYSNAYELNQYLVSLGYLVLSVNYRSGTGYGLDFREALNYGPAGASEYDDVKAAARYLHTRTDADASRIGIWGGSYGGYLTALALARDSATFKAGVDFHGVHDWRIEMDPAPDTPERAEFARLALASSPLADMSAWRSPVLLIHGDDDRNVSFLESIRLVEELRRRNVPFEDLIFPNETHHLLLWRHWVEAYTSTADFFERKLKPRQ